MPSPPAPFTFTNLQQALANNVLITAELFAQHDLDSLLDLRDQAPFDSQWLASFHAIDTQWQTADIDATALDALRQQVFISASRLTQQHEIASYICDDFELIGKMLLLEVAEPFIEYLLQQYLQQRFPTHIPDLV